MNWREGAKEIREAVGELAVCQDRARIIDRSEESDDQCVLSACGDER